MKCNAMTCQEAGKPLENAPLVLSALLDEEVQVKVCYSGLCASDVGAFGPAAFMYKFPLVAGHEGVGEITAVGSKVKHRKVGDVVGLGIFRNSCGDCKVCSRGKDNRCGEKKLMFMEGKTGSFGQYVHIDERYAIPIPSAIPMECAGPLMCAGCTVFSPFVEHDIRPGDRVGVLGIGGLGHLALQFAKAWGCEVTAFGRSDTKKAEAESFGAQHFVVTSKAEEVAAAKDSIDFLLVTASGPELDWAQLFGFLANGGQIVVMGFTGMTPIPVPPMAMIMKQCGIVGSAGNTRGAAHQMLEFAALHGIKPQIEVLSIAEINLAIKKVTEGTVRYRMVLKFD